MTINRQPIISELLTQYSQSRYVLAWRLGLLDQRKTVPQPLIE
ncbi:hypothetical protein [Gordonia rhizosphera]|nr:hypothetical protein [Gordonia rhizosphera]